jgi:hypothetical protein
MRGFDRLLPDLEANNTDIEPRPYSTCFWISYSLFMVAVGALSMWALFKYVIMGS